MAAQKQQPFSKPFTFARLPAGTEAKDEEKNMKNDLYAKDIKAGFYKAGNTKVDLAILRAIQKAVKGNLRGKPDQDGVCTVKGPLVGMWPTGEGHYIQGTIFHIEMTKKTPGKAKPDGEHVVALVDNEGNLWLYYSPNPRGLLEPLPGQVDVKQKRCDLVAFHVLDGDEIVPLWRWMGFKQKPLVSAVLSRIAWPDMATYKLPEMTGVLGYSSTLNYRSPNKNKKSASRSSSPVRSEEKKAKKAKKSKSKSKSKSKDKKEKKREKKEKRKARKEKNQAAPSLDARAARVAEEKDRLQAQLAALQRQLASLTETRA